MRHDLPQRPDNISEAPPHLIFHNFTTNLGKRTSDILRYLFPPSKETTTKIATFVNSHDTIYFRHYTWANARALAAAARKKDGEAAGEDKTDRQADEPSRGGALESELFKHSASGVKASTLPEAVDDVDLHEIGPRMGMRLYRIDLGTFDQKDLESEWTLRPFFNSQKAAMASATPTNDDKEK
eukprot:Selendium_serpulae@DN4947_c0_g1_i2.p1